MREHSRDGVEDHEKSSDRRTRELYPVRLLRLAAC